MDNQLETLLHTEQQVSDYFVLEAVIVPARTSDLYKAFDKSRGTHISLWVGKASLGINTAAVRAFLERMTRLQRAEPQVSKILSYGVDCTGVPFCVFPTLDGHALVHGHIERTEAERRFMAALRLMEKVHNMDLVCNDISSGSFWVQRTGEIFLLGVMGLHESDFMDGKVSPNPDSIFYLAPEQNFSEGSPAAIGMQSDVYALGVLGFRLFSGKFPQELAVPGQPPGEGVLLSDATQHPPVWGNQVFSTCMAKDPNARYTKAGSIISAINQVKENAAMAESVPARRSQEGSSLVANQTTSLKVARPITSTAVQKIEPKAPPQKNLIVKGLFIVLAVFTASFGIFLILFQKQGVQKPADDSLQIHERALKVDGLQPKLREAAANAKSKQDYYQQMVLSNDPVYHDVLIKAAKEAPDDEERFLAETAILDRARRLGLRRSAEIVRPWLRSLRTGQLPDAYEAVLRSLDVTLPPQAIDSSLRQAYTSYSRMILRLTAGLALDTGKMEQFQGVLSQLVGDATKATDLGERSTIAIILFSTELVSAFGDDAIQKREDIPDKDIVWLLDILASRNDINVRPIASLAMERKLLSPLRQEFLTPIRDREDLPLDILNSLVKAAAGKITSEDIGRFGSWYDRSGEDILLAICADTPDKEAKLAAFDILAAKTLSQEPAGTLIKWVRSRAWEKRANFIEPVGILSNAKYFDEQAVNKALETFDPYIKDPAVTSALLESPNQKLVKTAVIRYSKNISLGRRLLLLTHPDKDIRIMAVKSLEGINDLAGLKLIKDHYAKEKDPDVRKVYAETFWVISEQTQRGNF